MNPYAYICFGPLDPFRAVGPLADIVLNPLVNTQPVLHSPCQSLTIPVEPQNPSCLAFGHLHLPSGFNPQPLDFVPEPQDSAPNLKDLCKLDNL